MLERALRLRGRWIATPERASDLQAHTPELRIHPALKLIFRYGVIWAVALVIAMAGVSYVAAPAKNPTLIPGPYEDAAPLANKLLYYRQHRSDYNLVLLGDSLTYTGLHPEFIDPLLGTRSVNLAIFAHWFATQYPLI